VVRALPGPGPQDWRQAAIDPKLAYWTAALVDLFFVVACGLTGVWRIRHRRAHGHRRMMLVAAGLVGLFLVSYVLKVALAGREDPAPWSAASLWTLYVHEACVATMLVAAGLAAARARRFGPLRDGEVPAPEASEHDRRVHRGAGRVAVVASILALLTAAGVLAGMYARAGF
jgi:uncharacterized membrane protein YozB (DUF420 family)